MRKVSNLSEFHPASLKALNKDCVKSPSMSFRKAHQKMEEQGATIAQLKSGIEVLTATVKEQAAQIQKVTAQLEASKPAPQVVNNP